MKKSKEVLKSIIERLELGHTLSSICKSKEMPGLTTVHTWTKQDNKFKEELLNARRLGAMTWLDKMQDLLDSDCEPQQVQWNREKLHHARWMASKLISIFGDKQTVENVGDPIIKIVWDDGGLERKQTEHAHASRGSEDDIDKTIDNKAIN
jgi:hypothetical protein|tara:strand:- start:63 stop:515 length:453 start_codon:yes stop_codon:yes gene_type:complete